MLVIALIFGVAASAQTNLNSRLYLPASIQMSADEVYNLPVYLDAAGEAINSFQFNYKISEGFEAGEAISAPRLDTWDGVKNEANNIVTYLSFTGSTISNEHDNTPVVYIPISRKAGSTKYEGYIEFTYWEVNWLGEDGITVVGNDSELLTTPVKATISIVSDDISLEAADVIISAGETAKVSVGLNNAQPLTMASMWINVPEGITLDNFKLAMRPASTGSFLQTQKNSDTMYTVVIANFSGVDDGFPGNSGEIFTFDATASDTFDGGKIVIDHVEFTNIQADLIPVKDLEINLSKTSAINSAVVGDGTAKYYNLNGIEVTPTPGNVYIKVVNGVAKKVYVNN